MTAVELGKTNMFIASDPIATAKELQTHLAAMPLDAQLDFAEHAIDALGNTEEIYGGPKLLLHALGAYVLDEGLSASEALYHGRYFADAVFNTWFRRFVYVQHPCISSLCLRLADTEILASPSNPDFVGERIRSGVFVPVHAVESAFAA